MKKFEKTLLDSVKGAALLHRGGEASIYLLNVGGAPYVLKWYNEGFSFDESVVERACKVREPGLYRIEEWGNRDGTPYLIYDYINGESSETLGRMMVAVALVALRQVAQTLAALRKQGVSHGDLSPANVIFAMDGDGGGNAGLGLRTVLIDCGIVGPGALAYAAPERFQGKPADEKSDLFSLGLLLYRWIAGEDLITADGYEQFAEQMANVQDLNISEKLYATGAFDSPEGAQQLSALEPLWSGLLCADISDRVEDFDELDEILEIALDKVSHGEIALAGCVTQYIQTLKVSECNLNVGRKVPVTLEKGLPFVICKKNNWLKWTVLGVSGLILLLIVLLLTSGTMSFGIDATGDRLLKRSRNIEPSVESEKAPDLKVDSLLMELPVPSAE
jgi:serine/threonine protein kinase